MSRRVPMFHVLVVWADGRRQMSQAGGLANQLIMPRELPGGGWEPAVFDREVVAIPRGWHGPFESDFWIDGDTGITKMVLYREQRS